VSDFGLAKSLDEAVQTQSGVIAGTPSYVLADHFGKPQDVFERFPKARAFIAPPDGMGQREIK